MSDQTRWFPLADAPKDTVLLGIMGNVISLFALVEEPARHEKRRSWFFGKERDVEIEKGGVFIRLIIPTAGGYHTMNLRPDFGWRPKFWCHPPGIEAAIAEAGK